MCWLAQIFGSDAGRVLTNLPKPYPKVRYHSLLAEKGGAVERFREFVVFDGAFTPRPPISHVRACGPTQC